MNIFNWLASKISGFTNIDKAIAAFLGAFGIQLDWSGFAGAIDWSTAIKALIAGGPQAALMALIPGFLAWLSKNKHQVTIKPGAGPAEANQNFNRPRGG